MSNSKVNKLKDFEEIGYVVTYLKKQGKKIVFTNGCFDIIHSGHIRYLREAKSLGDVLILGLNSDESVRRLKGMNRPITNETDRSIVASGLEMVDYVVIFEEDTPYNLIETIKPDVLVKGGDWSEEQIVGAEIVKEFGGTVKSLSYHKGKSTSEIIAKIESTDNFKTD